MHIEENQIYHIYNRSNEKVFFNRENYLYFLKKVNKLIKPCCEILAWCLMPNHFHFLIFANEKSPLSVNEKHRPNLQVLSKQFATLTSNYTQAINKQQGRYGSLWAHATKAKKLSGKSYIRTNKPLKNNNIFTCFNYIHQNPLQAKLVSNIDEWEFSSFLDYNEMRNGKLVNRNLAYEIINYDKENFHEQSVIFLDEKKLKRIY